MAAPAPIPLQRDADERATQAVGRALRPAKRGQGRYPDPGLPEGWQTKSRTTSSGHDYVEHHGPDGQVSRTKVGAWRADATRLRAEEAAADDELEEAEEATADGEADAAVAAAFGEHDDDVQVHALARREGLVLRRSVAWQKIGVGGRSAANVGVGTGRSSNSHMKKTDTGFDSVFKNRNNRFEARLKVPRHAAAPCRLLRHTPAMAAPCACPSPRLR